ncbi:hypothetical protein P280DRAFT_3637 [Massarina eburnea CBS 473.64]|uniref:Uncharacterized protein n=1 Tax=Massarina eburnea CBS 473.64 TaxID=1395130 RepID=A0A6A6SE57_9PLEO|nr:hypothetical protein P280DRAFT_3637 [Massarina eburnea CBS 473.64]
MSPLPSLSAGEPRSSSSHSTLNGNGVAYTQLSRIFLLVLVLVTGIRLVIARVLRKRRRSQPHQPYGQGKKPTTSSCQARSESQDFRQHRQSPSNNQWPSMFNPVYPWECPPQPLPGPYDPRLYPLPTIRRHSYDPTTITPTQNKSLSYIRRVSADTIPMSQTVLQGTVTTSTRGWRRNQWVISGK